MEDGGTLQTTVAATFDRVRILGIGEDQTQIVHLRADSAHFYFLERFDIENISTLCAGFPWKAAPRNYRKANLLRR